MSVEFVQSLRSGKLAIYEGYTFRLNRNNKNNGCSYWKCTERERYRCMAKLTLRGGQFVTFSGKHEHLPRSEKIKHRIFTQKLKERMEKDLTATAIKIYRQELAEESDLSPEVLSCLPTLRSVHRALSVKRGVKKPTVKSRTNRTLVVLDQSLYKMEFVDSYKGNKMLILDGHIFKLQRCLDNNTYWSCMENGCSATASLSRSSNRLLRLGGKHNHDAPEAKVRRKKFYQTLKVRITQDPSESLSKIYREELEKFASSPEIISKLPSEKEATSVMLKMMEQEPNPVSTTDKPINDEPIDSNLDQAIPLKVNSSKAALVLPIAKIKKPTPEVCITINVEKELAQADPYDPSLSPSPPNSPRTKNPISSTISASEAMTCERFPVNEVHTSALNPHNKPNTKVAYQGYFSLSNSNSIPSNASTETLRTMAYNQFSGMECYAPSSLYQKKMSDMVRFDSSNPFSSSQISAELPSRTMHYRRFPAHNIHEPSSFNQNMIKNNVFSDHSSLTTFNQRDPKASVGVAVCEHPPSTSSTITPSNTLNSEQTPVYNVTSSTENQLKPPPKAAQLRTFNFPSFCPCPSNMKMAHLEAENYEGTTRRNPLSFATLPSEIKAIEQFLVNNVKTFPSNYHKPNRKINKDIYSSNSEKSLAESNYKKYESFKVGTEYLNTENKLKARIAHPCKSSVSSLNTNCSNAAKLPLAPSRGAAAVPLEVLTTGYSITSKLPLETIPYERHAEQVAGDVPLEMIPRKQTRTDKNRFPASSNGNRPGMNGAMTYLLAFANNYWWNYSCQPHHQFDLRNNPYRDIVPLRQEKINDPCLQDYSHVPPIPPTANSMIQPHNICIPSLQAFSRKPLANPPATNPMSLPDINNVPCLQDISNKSTNSLTANQLTQTDNISVPCLQDISNKSLNAESANLFHAPVFIKEELVFSEEEL